MNFGVKPSNFLLLANKGRIPIIGAPVCIRGRQTNVIDWIPPRLLPGEILVHEDLVQMGLGGVLEDTSQRPMPSGGQSGKSLL